MVKVEGFMVKVEGFMVKVEGFMVSSNIKLIAILFTCKIIIRITKQFEHLLCLCQVPRFGIGQDRS